ncbi:hypothetical protein F2Q69_00013828 [Brassica cretica]|uniref:Uncharacterized protein n=1 Tax=Brassica cretica TaxID=69181 RepID=A0A8S9QU37_BRACR|nr:hypothetical protein F2Q69_00013828 [Brassica cretica]
MFPPQRSLEGSSVLLIGSFPFFWKGARFQGPNSGFLLAGTWSVPLSRTRGSRSCLEAGGNDTGVFFPNSLPLISRFCHRNRGITCALKSTGVAHSQQAPPRQDPIPLVMLAWVPLKPGIILNPEEIILNFEFCGPRSAEMYDFLGNTSNGFPSSRIYSSAFSSLFLHSLLSTQLSIRNRLTMSKRSASSTPSMTNRAGSRRRVDSPVSRSDSSPDPGTGSEGVILALVASLCDFFEISPSQLNPPSWRLLVAIQNLAGTNPVLPEGEDTVVRTRQLPLNRRQVLFLLSDSVLHRSSLWGNMSGNTSNDPFAAYQEAAKVMSTKKGSASRTVSVGDLVITGSRRAATVKIEPSALVQTKKSRGGGMATRSLQHSAEVAHSVGSLATALSNLNLQVFPQDGTILPSGEPSEVVQVLQGGLLRTISQLFHFGERLSIESSLVSQEELDDLKRQVSEERAQRVAREMEIRDLKDKLKDMVRTAEISSADTLSIGKKNQELEEAIETLRLKMVMAVNGARVTAWWELMGEWLQKKSNQWDLAKALEQYKTVALEEAQNKGALVPTFEDEPVVPHVSRMDIDLRPGGSSS